MKKLFLCLLLLTGCGKLTPLPAVKIDPRILPYYEQYQQDKYLYTGMIYMRHHIDIQFKDLSATNYDGVCHWGDVQFRYIDIDLNFWNISSDDRRTTLLYHELGHCDLDLAHSSSPTIMNKYGLDGYSFGNNKIWYLTQFFRQGI